MKKSFWLNGVVTAYKKIFLESFERCVQHTNGSKETISFATFKWRRNSWLSQALTHGALNEKARWNDLW